MSILLLLWLVLGAVIGCLTCLANLAPSAWRRLCWLALPLLGIVIALVAGWLGTLLVGKYLATAIVLWVTITGTVCFSRLLPWAVMKSRR